MRRAFLKKCAAAGGLALLGPSAWKELFMGEGAPGLDMGFRDDAPEKLDRFSRPAAFAVRRGRLVQCVLCPHACILGENDRGYCRTRVVKDGVLQTVAYGNLCTAALDPVEKKPLYHFLPGRPILSVAIGGCNLRCLNCQNWEISQRRPAEVAEQEAFPEELVELAVRRKIPLLAYTYSEPIVWYEYVRDTAALARRRGLRNVLVTAGFIHPRPLRELCPSIDAVTLDVKALTPALFRRISTARVEPVLRALRILREEGVWVEVSFLMVPTLSDSPDEIGRFAGWVAENLGPGTPLHLLRFHPANRLLQLPPTPIEEMEQARRRARESGLDFVYLGNVAGREAGSTYCPRDGRLLIERDGMEVVENHLVGGRCPCGEVIPGVFT